MNEWNPNLPEVPLPRKNRPKWKKPKPKPKRRGRKKLVRPFELTYLGEGLKLYAPLEYEIIMAATGGKAPEADFVEQVSYSSTNLYFKTQDFRQSLMLYRELGCVTGKLFAKPSIQKKVDALYLRRKYMCET